MTFFFPFYRTCFLDCHHTPFSQLILPRTRQCQTIRPPEEVSCAAHHWYVASSSAYVLCVWRLVSDVGGSQTGIATQLEDIFLHRRGSFHKACIQINFLLLLKSGHAQLTIVLEHFAKVHFGKCSFEKYFGEIKLGKCYKNKWWGSSNSFNLCLRHYVRSCDETIPEALQKI